MRRYQQPALLFLLSVPLILVAFLSSGTGDSGDSVTHYLFARYAFAHPVHFLDHWAKPVFVLLSAPFAHFGFAAMKLFNVLVGICTAFLLVRIAKLAGIRNTLLVPVFLFCFPMYTICLFSGLTEPLFGLLLVLGIWMIFSGRLRSGLVVLSFLPFCRSEGLVILVVAAFYLLMERKPRQLIWLVTGHVVYSVAGYFYYHDLLWVFNRIPYLGTESSYGRGGWLHYFRGAPPVFGIPLTVLTFFGLLTIPSFLRRSSRKNEVMLMTCSFLGVFCSHVIFWKFGLFRSDGLLRVMVAILPMAALLAVMGLNKLIELAARMNSHAATVINRILIVYALAFPFMPNPAAFKIPGDFSLKDDQLMLNEAAAWISREVPDAVVLTKHNYLAMALGIDPFDAKRFIDISDIKRRIYVPDNMVVVWENWYAPTQAGVSLEELERNGLLVKKAAFEKGNAQVVVFTKSRPVLF